mgnify:CR=1 FL=1
MGTILFVRVITCRTGKHRCVVTTPVSPSPPPDADKLCSRHRPPPPPPPGPPPPPPPEAEKGLLGLMQVLQQFLSKGIQIQSLGEEGFASLGGLGRGVVIAEHVMKAVPVMADGGSGS